MRWFVGIDWGREIHAARCGGRHGPPSRRARIADTAEGRAVVLRLDFGVCRRLAVTDRGGDRVAAGRAHRRLSRARVPRVRRQSEAARSLRDRHTVAGERRPARRVGARRLVRTDAGAFQPVRHEDPIVVQLRDSRAPRSISMATFRRLANQLPESAASARAGRADTVPGPMSPGCRRCWRRRRRRRHNGA